MYSQFEEWTTVSITSAEDSQNAVDYILEQKQMEPVSIICSGEKQGDADGKITVLVISMKGRSWIYQLCNTEEDLMEAGKLKQLFFDSDLMKVFHDVTWQSAVLFKQYEIVLDGTKVFDSKVICQKKLLDDKAMESLRLEGFIPSRWDEEDGKIHNSKWTQNPLDKELINKLVERCKALLQFYKIFTMQKLPQPKKEIYIEVNKYVDKKRARETKKNFKSKTEEHQDHSASSSKYGKRQAYRGRGDLGRGVFEHPGGNRGCFPRSPLETFGTYGQRPMEAFFKNVPGTESSVDHGIQVDDEDSMFLSNMLSIILRHGTEKLKFKLLPGGFLYVDEIWKKMQKLGNFTKNDLMRALAQNDKQRFSLQKEEITGHLKIRDNQEHTVEWYGKKLMEYNIGEHGVPVSQPYQLGREYHEALYYQHQGSAEEVSRKKKINRKAKEGIEKEAIPEPDMYEHEEKDIDPICLGVTPTELKLPSTLREQRNPAAELLLELAVGSAYAEDETEPCNRVQRRGRMNTLSGSPAASSIDKMEDPIGLSPLWPVALEPAPEYNQLHLNPNHFFLGAPSTVMKSHAATVLQNVRRRALCHKDGRKVEFLSPDSAACVLKKERCVLPDGSIYELTSTWIPDPECKEKKEQLSQTEKSIMKTLETGVQCDIIKLNI